ncbi:hypothetical protein KW797_02190 [Candidatus Parcubacteria bacterium]|nr:hypothetical protein [Candidatus Parcubacteria bacterium]
MSNYEVATIDDRGPEPLLRTRATVTVPSQLTTYKVRQEDLERVHRFGLDSIALKLFGDESFADLLRDVNDFILDERTLKTGDVIFVPIFWQQLAAASKASVPTGRTRVSRTVR